MAQLTVEVGGRSYRLTCDDGQQEHVFALSQRIDALMPKVNASKAPANEARNVLMAAILIADELHALEAQQGGTQNRSSTEVAEMERAITEMLNNASDQIETVTKEIQEFR